jgi:hypothetical protein
MNLMGIGSHVTGLGCGAWRVGKGTKRVGKGTIGVLLLGGRISYMARLWVLVPALRELYCSFKEMFSRRTKNYRYSPWTEV